MAVLPTGIGPVTGGYQIERSLRFNSADSAYLNRTPGSAGNLRKWTWSGWVKRSTLGVRQAVFACSNAAGNDYVALEFLANDKLVFIANNTSPSEQFRLETNAVFRDPSAWYHIVVFFDTAQATASNRAAIYINGVLQTYSTAGYMPQNYDGRVNTTNQHNLGSWLPALGLYFNGYMTEVNFINNQVPTTTTRTVNGVTETILTQLGEFSSSTGVWTPKAWDGTYGTNGFYLKFADNSNTTAATLGKDSSGNGNNWTPNLFSVTAGAGNDSLVDTPTNYGGDTGVGGEVRGNYATLNPLKTPGGNGSTFNGNLNVSTLSGDGYYSATISISSGKWYAEITPTYLGTTGLVGVVDANKVAPTSYPNLTAFGWTYLSSGNKANNSSSVSYGASWAANDVIGIALDMDAGTVTFYKNGVSQGQAYSGITGDITFCCYDGSSTNYADFTCNFGQRPFAYTAPSGFKALCTQNLPTPTIGATSTTQANDYMNVVLYTGNNTANRAITGVGFQPDWVWFKTRNAANSHVLYDVLRGVNNQLTSNNTAAEINRSGQLISFDSDGFTVTDDAALTDLNSSDHTYVAWNWKANGAGSSNTAGTITSTVSVNTTSGFSIVKHVNTGVAATIGHGLGVAPVFIINKVYDRTENWRVYFGVANKLLFLNSTAAEATDTNIWNNTQPTSTVFSIGAYFSNGDDIISYCFAPVAGYSAFGSYTGNGSGTGDGPFVYTGFRPRYVLIKKTTTGAGNGEWYVHDTARDDYNQARFKLYPSSTVAENGVAGETTTTNAIDILSNGFKLRTGNGATNESAIVYIYAAFAEHPFKYSLAR